MKHVPTTLLTLVLAAMPATLSAQNAPAPAKPAATKDAPEVANAKKLFADVLDAVDGSWFGKPYQGVNTLELSGSMTINLSAAAVNAKVEQATQGAVKAAGIKNGKANLGVRGNYMASGDCRFEFTGDSGDMVYSRVGNKGFWYIKNLNAYTTRIDAPPTDAPLTFLGWFRQLVLEVKAVYADSGTFKVTQGAPDGNLQTLIFSSPTGAYDPKKREQSMDDTLGFWKRGRLEVTFDKNTKIPLRAFFFNEAQGVRATMTFNYGQGGRLQNVSFDNQSKGMEGPMSLRVSYGNDGLAKAISGELSAKVGRIAWDFGMNWSKGSRIAGAVPPPNAEKKGREDLQALFYVGLAGQVMELQRLGLNLRSPSLGR